MPRSTNMPYELRMTAVFAMQAKETVLMPTPTQWAHESCDRRDDPESGARIIQLTGSAAISNNIYCEEPYGSPDGTRVAAASTHTPT